MTRYILKRLGLTVITLVIVSFVVFAASQLLPGDVGRTILGPYASQQQVDALDKSLGNDKPLPVRYWNWASDFVKGDWGVSPVQNVEVRPLVLGRLKNSLYLAAFAMVLIVPFSVFMGVVAALKYGKLADRAISIIGLSFIALPEFVASAGHEPGRLVPAAAPARHPHHVRPLRLHLAHGPRGHGRRAPGELHADGDPEGAAPPARRHASRRAQLDAPDDHRRERAGGLPGRRPARRRDALRVSGHRPAHPRVRDRA
jgi:hypothetical protein